MELTIKYNYGVWVFVNSSYCFIFQVREELVVFQGSMEALAEKVLKVYQEEQEQQGQKGNLESKENQVDQVQTFTLSI